MSVRMTERSAQLALLAAVRTLEGRLDAGASVVDLGPWAGQDLAHLLPALTRPRTIQLAAPESVDLGTPAGRLARSYPEADVVTGETLRTGWPVHLVPHGRRQRIVHVCGDWVWSMRPAVRRAFLNRLRRAVRGNDLALISCPLVQDSAILEARWHSHAAQIAAALGSASPVRCHFDAQAAVMRVLGRTDGARLVELARVPHLTRSDDGQVAGPHAAGLSALAPAVQVEALVPAPDGSSGYLVIVAGSMVPSA